MFSVFLFPHNVPYLYCPSVTKNFVFAECTKKSLYWPRVIKEFVLAKCNKEVCIVVNPNSPLDQKKVLSMFTSCLDGSL